MTFLEAYKLSRSQRINLQILDRSLAHKDNLLIRFNENIAKHREKGLGDE